MMGMVHCVRSALPLLRTAAWARIVNFSAHSTQRQSVVLPAYTAAKAALTSISKNLSLLLAKDEILVNVVSRAALPRSPWSVGPSRLASTGTTLTS
ncbi:short chain dehydrogenase family protein [Mycobacterium xenopi 4042]|uniref:Short chain dehydrogenase family protein n=1 Tax=Mycobacterium xenopi 4042 TaxID=1299334 RepID=X8E5V6_MYCXE|nr:short chain dehydrogenase family protein [Mycobacterium xenopi 4042]